MIESNAYQNIVVIILFDSAGTREWFPQEILPSELSFIDNIHHL